MAVLTECIVVFRRIPFMIPPNQVNRHDISDGPGIIPEIQPLDLQARFRHVVAKENGCTGSWFKRPDMFGQPAEDTQPLLNIANHHEGDILI